MPSWPRVPEGGRWATDGRAPGVHAEVVLEDVTVPIDVEQAKRGFMHRRALHRIERHLLDQRLELFRQRRLAAADRSEQVKNLLFLLQALRRMAEVGDDMFDHLLHAVQVAEGRIAAQHLVGENARQAGVGARIDEFRFADGLQHPLGDAGVSGSIPLAQVQVILDRHFLFLRRLETALVAGEDGHDLPPCKNRSVRFLEQRSPKRFSGGVDPSMDDDSQKAELVQP